MRTEVTAAPGMELNRVRRSELPSVYPKPGSNGSIVKRERWGFSDSSVSVGRCAISTFVSFQLLVGGALAAHKRVGWMDS